MIMRNRKNIHWYLVFESMEEARNRVPLNKTVRVEIPGKTLCLAHSPDGFYATDDRCPHQGLPVSRGGVCEDGHLVCPFHRYAWSLHTGKESRGIEANMRFYEVIEDKEGLFIGIPQKRKWWQLF